MAKVTIEKFNIPNEVSRVTETLQKAGFEAYLVGGCVRDLFMGRKPKDWDLTTNATPEAIMSLFPKTFYENKFGTVAVVDENTDDESLKIIEITPYRIEGAYSDYRRPDNVVFSQNIEDDLRRRDFTINAIAYDPTNNSLIDPFGGVADLARMVIRAVGIPEDRFNEDGLRIIRAIRFHVELDFPLDPETEKAIISKKEILKNVSRERIRDELVRIIMSPRPMQGFLLLKKLDLLSFLIPELEESVGVEQNKAHAFDVWIHLLKTLQHSADKDYPLHIRLAALFHDIAKPATRRWDEQGKQWTFYGHEVVGSRVTKKILEDLKFSRETIDKVSKLVRWHMFFSDTESVTLSSVRRLVVNVGPENIWDLVNVRLCDRIGTGRPKENPYRLRKYQAMIEEAMRSPISVQMLKIDGKRIMELLAITPGPRVGQILSILLEDVLEEPILNTTDYLEAKAKQLASLSDTELSEMAYRAKNILENKEESEIKKIRKRHYVE